MALAYGLAVSGLQSVYVIAMADQDAPRFTNNTSDLPIPAAEKRDRFEAEGDALGALGWRCSQARDLLNALANAVDDRNPHIQGLEHPPTWGDVRRMTKTLESLGHLAVYLGVATSFGEVRGTFGLPEPEGDR